jgi:putative spermidine/putrescine transport system permease protein
MSNPAQAFGRNKVTASQTRDRQLPLSRLLAVPASLFLAFFVVSMLLLLRYSFNDWTSQNGMTPAWTLKQYYQIFTNPHYYGVILNTLRISLLSTAGTLVLGYPVAYLISISRRKNALILIVSLPLLMSTIIRAFGWLVILGSNGVINQALIRLHLIQEPIRLYATEFSLVIALITELLPFMVLPIEGVLERIDVSLREAAMTLGANPAKTFAKITLPLSMPGMLAGTVVTFALAASAFSFPLLLGGGNIRVMSLEIRQRMTFTLNWPLGSAQAVMLVLLVFLLLVILNRVLGRWSGATTSNQ